MLQAARGNACYRRTADLADRRLYAAIGRIPAPQKPKKLPGMAGLDVKRT
jgi:hypothetical protein